MTLMTFKDILAQVILRLSELLDNLRLSELLYEHTALRLSELVGCWTT